MRVTLRGFRCRSLRACLTQKQLAFRQGRDLKSALTGGVQPFPLTSPSHPVLVPPWLFGGRSEAHT